MCNKEFAERLEIAIKKIGGVGLACSKAGITYPTLTRWKEGTSDPKLSNIVAFAEAANVSLDWLVNGSGGDNKGVGTAIPDIAAISAEKGISIEEAIDTLKNMIQDTQPKLTEEEAFLLKEFRVLDDDQKRLMLRFIIGGFDSLNNSGSKGIFNSPNSRIKSSFTE